MKNLNLQNILASLIFAGWIAEDLKNNSMKLRELWKIVPLKTLFAYLRWSLSPYKVIDMGQNYGRDDIFPPHMFILVIIFLRFIAGNQGNF